MHNLCAAPIMFHVEHDPSILVELDKGLESVENVDYIKVRKTVNDLHNWFYFLSFRFVFNKSMTI